MLARLLGSSSFVSDDDDGEVGFDNDKALGRIKYAINNNAGDESDVLLATKATRTAGIGSLPSTIEFI